jgi:hypothetical protein
MEQTSVVSLAPPPPPVVLRMMNVVMRPVLGSRVGRRIDGVMLLEFKGRRTGHRYRVPVNYHLVGGVPMSFTDAPWRHNFAGGAPVRVTHRGRRHDTRGTLVPMNPVEMGIAVRKSLDTGGSAQRIGIKFPEGHDPTASELAGLALGSGVIRFDFRPGL